MTATRGSSASSAAPGASDAKEKARKAALGPEPVPKQLLNPDSRLYRLLAPGRHRFSTKPENQETVPGYRGYGRHVTKLERGRRREERREGQD
ncbi:hypothetical protein H920_06676 [Fukomys damarensis]|uniref:Uncharacterized protein n=1 Tax=Fukomys damarensis TaxID=885580 RepID=A0A091DNQ8_FUKDA|nr:hypothetical protein H920_06676 [Fukomys damarensis]